MNFDEIKSCLSDSGAKNDQTISRALELLPVRVVLLMTAREAAQYVQAVFDACRHGKL